MNHVRHQFILLVIGWLLTSTCPLLAGVNIGAIGRILPASGIVEMRGTPGTQIETIIFEQGQKAQKEDILVVFDNNTRLQNLYNYAIENIEYELSEAQSALDFSELNRQKAAITVEQNQSEVDRYATLSNDTIVPREQTRRMLALKQAKVAYKIVELEYAKALEKIRFLKETKSIRKSIEQSKLEGGTLKAPFAGVILSIKQDIGEDAGGLVLQFASLENILVRAELYESDLALVQEGMSAIIKHSALGSELKGHVIYRGRLIDSKKKIGFVDIALDEPRNAINFLNMEVDVIFQKP